MIEHLSSTIVTYLNYNRTLLFIKKTCHEKDINAMEVFRYGITLEKN